MIDGGDSEAVAVRVASNVRTVTGQRERALAEGWELLRTAPSAIDTPERLAREASGWRKAIVPGTVAMVEPKSSGQLDASDYWYRCRFGEPGARQARALLCFDGLATLADVWLNGRLLLKSENMFRAHVLDVSAWLVADNELCICFRALAPVLRARKPRGRWPTRLVSEKNLRFIRTSLLGYMPGFCPPLPPIGPWRAVRLLSQSGFAVEHVRLRPRLIDGAGVLEADITCRLLAGGELSGAELRLGDARAPLRVERKQDEIVLCGQATLEAASVWWPHTHGTPALHAAEVVLELGAEAIRIELGPVGFRALALEQGDGAGFALRINGERVFCRGACWTPLDASSLHTDAAAYTDGLTVVRDAGMNMLRVGGTMVYESDDFYRACDELGILVWQDFMFANMDYPIEDASFLASCTTEAGQWLERVASRPCLSVLCGGSEVAQQAAMMGMPAELWSNALFDRVLPELCASLCPEVPYVPSSPSQGAMPFHSGAGPSHYYGVGAYLRPLEDARTTRVRFASECLAFSNVPEDASLVAWLGDQSVQVHHPSYKERVPRDGGAGWDFADVTDHYVELLYGVKARGVRYADHDRYLRLCRAATGEVMARVQGLWRRNDSSCRGALIWFLRDLWQGAGWGVVDSTGAPKAPYYYLKRAWAPLALWFVDEGIDGLLLHVDNERSERVSARIELALYRKDGALFERTSAALELAGREQRAFSVEAMIGRFVDSSYAYRFGPPAHTLVTARLERALAQGTSEVLAQTFHLPLGLGHEPETELGLTAAAHEQGDGSYLVTVQADRFAQSVSVEARGYLPSDNYFHLAPRVPHHFTLRALPSAGPLRATLRALNAIGATLVRVEPVAATPAPEKQ